MTDDSSTETESAGAEDERPTDVQSVVDSDSSFYGSTALRQKFENRVLEENPYDYWRIHDWNLQVIAARAVKKNPQHWTACGAKRKRDDDVNNNSGSKRAKSAGDDGKARDFASRLPPSKPHNPYEGCSNALQLGESVEDFLRRLPPSSASEQPWIWCANFSADRHSNVENTAIYKQVGSRLLENFLAKRCQLEASFDPPKPASSISRMMTADRLNLEQDIIRTARENGITRGKWMLFPTVDRVDSYWAAVVRGTVEGGLGVAAKVATRQDRAQDSTRVILVYTKDFRDEKDIKRVLFELVRLKLASAIPGPLRKGAHATGQIWYKPDYYTYLDLMSGNEFKIKPTLYGTSSLLTLDDMRKLS